jgi:hypothetical protein
MFASVLRPGHGAAALLAAALVAGAFPSPARADKQVCADAYGETQRLHKAGRLIEAREQALVCQKDVCPEFIRVDCVQWLAQIEASQPSLVVVVRDATGVTRSDATIEIDGKPWSPGSSAAARPIDPGVHTLRVTIPGAPPREEQVVLRDGDKDKQVEITFAAPPEAEAAPLVPPAPPPPAPTPDQREAPSADAEGPGAAPWIVGGAGVALLAVGAVLGVLVIGEKSTFDEHCDEQRGTCDEEGLAARDTGEALGPISTVALVLGGVGVGVGAVWLIAGSTSDAPTGTLRAGPSIRPDGGAWRFTGTF